MKILLDWRRHYVRCVKDLEASGIETLHMVSYRSQKNGRVAKMNRTIWNGIRTLQAQAIAPWGFKTELLYDALTPAACGLVQAVGRRLMRCWLVWSIVSDICRYWPGKFESGFLMPGALDAKYRLVDLLRCLSPDTSLMTLEKDLNVKTTRLCLGREYLFPWSKNRTSSGSPVASLEIKCGIIEMKLLLIMLRMDIDC